MLGFGFLFRRKRRVRHKRSPWRERNGFPADKSTATDVRNFPPTFETPTHANKTRDNYLASEAAMTYNPPSDETPWSKRSRDALARLFLAPFRTPRSRGG